MNIPRCYDTRADYGKLGDALTILVRGTLSLGTEFPGQSFNYAAFPALCLCPDGEWLGMWQRAGSHNEANSYIAQERTTGGGVAWEGTVSETVFWDTVPAPDPLRQIDVNPLLAVLSTGRIFASWSVGTNPDMVPFYQFTRFSDDSGLTWTEPGDPLDSFGYWTIIAGCKPIERENGDLLWAAYAKLEESNRYDVLILVSSDGGETWSLRGPIFTDGTTQFEEPQLVPLDDGRIMLLIRVDNDHTIRRCYTSDEGETFSELETIFSGWGRPNCLQLSNGNLIAFSRHYDPTPPIVGPGQGTVNDPNQYSFYRLSRDRGLTWRPEQRFSNEFYLYVDLVEHNGLLRVLHAMGQRGSLNRTTLEIVHMAVPN